MRFEKKYIEIPDGKLCYESSGKGKELVIIGGSLGGGAEYMYPLMEELSQNYHCILLHQRGTIGSELVEISRNTISLDHFINDIDALRKSLNLASIRILSHSWGAMLACAYLNKYPSGIENLIMVNSMGLSTAAFAFLIDNIMHAFSGPDQDKLKYLINQNQRSPDFETSYKEFFKFAQSAYFFDKSLTTSFQRNMIPSFFSLEIYQFMLEDLIKKRFDLRAEFANNKIPVSLIWGRQDIMGVQPVVETSKAFENLNSRVIERCGHYPWFEQKEKFYSILLSMLKSD